MNRINAEANTKITVSHRFQHLVEYLQNLNRIRPNQKALKKSNSNQ
jgi:hypothetical protein